MTARRGGETCEPADLRRGFREPAVSNAEILLLDCNRVLARAIELLASEAVVFKEVADTLKTDAALSAEVLRMASLSLLGGRNS
jgi:HD-like signal output (HDOD) protein